MGKWQKHKKYNTQESQEAAVITRLQGTDETKPNQHNKDLVLYINRPICIIMNINENLKMGKTPLGNLSSPTLRSLDMKLRYEVGTGNMFKPSSE